MTEQEVEALERIWKGKTIWGPEWEKTLDDLAAGGYIEISEKRRAAGGGRVRLTKFLSGLPTKGSAT